MTTLLELELLQLNDLDTSCRVLADFAGKHGDSVHVIHLITGYASGSLTMQLADGKSFEGQPPPTVPPFHRSPRKSLLYVLIHCAGVLRSLADGAASHVYSVGAKRSVDPAAKLYSAVASQAATLCNETSPRGEAYRRNKCVCFPSPLSCPYCGYFKSSSNLTSSIRRAPLLSCHALISWSPPRFLLFA